jgi:FkbH-like protein
MIAMQWLPVPADFRRDLQLAVNTLDPAERLERLAMLAQCRLGFVETIQLDNALKRVEGAGSGFMPVRLALLASSTVDHLLPPIRIAGLRRRLLIEVYVGAFGQFRQELLDTTSALHRFNPDFVLFALGCRELLASVPIVASKDEVDRAVMQAVSDLEELWQRARGLHASVIQQSFLDITEPVFGSYDRLVPAAPSQLVDCLNSKAAVAVSREAVLWLDIARLSARDGIEAWFDSVRWYQGKIEISPQAATIYGDVVARLIAAQRGQSKKCLVLDLDNTLWGGVLGDVGLENIVLGQGSGAGEAHLALQRYAKALKERGIMLAVCSKNEEAVADAAFNEHPEMVLTRQDMSAFIVNWSDKAENLRTIAKQLNIGLDSLVFVDDNPAERARVRESLPMVAVPELPDDPTHYVRSIADAGYFEAVSFTEEDQQRVGQYAANEQRETLRNSLQSMDDFLRGLDMSVHFGPVTTRDLARATQLINKTNQFNTTTRRITAEELAELAADPHNIVLQFRLADRFGDNGLVSVMLICQARGDPSTLEVANWVMSCRVFGRQLEDEAMNIAV